MNKKLGFKRNTLKIVLLSVATLGVYYVYWYINLQNQIYKQTEQGFKGAIHIVLSFFTGGVYAVYWHFAVGNYIKKCGGRNRSLLYGLPFVAAFVITLMFCITFIRNAIGIPTAPWLSYLIGGLVMFITMLACMALIQNDVNKLSLNIDALEGQEQ